MILHCAPVAVNLVAEEAAIEQRVLVPLMGSKELIQA